MKTSRFIGLAPVKYAAMLNIGIKKRRIPNLAPAMRSGVTPMTAMYLASSHEYIKVAPTGMATVNGNAVRHAMRHHF